MNKFEVLFNEEDYLANTAYQLGTIYFMGTQGSIDMPVREMSQERIKITISTLQDVINILNEALIGTGALTLQEAEKENAEIDLFSDHFRHFKNRDT